MHRNIVGYARTIQMTFDPGGGGAADAALCIKLRREPAVRRSQTDERKKLFARHLITCVPLAIRRTRAPHGAEVPLLR